jgi:hypothetical protein
MILPDHVVITVSYIHIPVISIFITITSYFDFYHHYQLFRFLSPLPGISIFITIARIFSIFITISRSGQSEVESKTRKAHTISSTIRSGLAKISRKFFFQKNLAKFSSMIVIPVY